MGDINLDGSYGTAENFQVIRRIRHPQFQPPLVYNDIALLEINKEVKFSKNIKPACLYPNSSLDALAEITATGWGLTEFSGTQANILQTVGLDLFSPKECNNSYKSAGRRIPNGVLDESQICAGGRDKELDTCQGDSGGPLQWKGDWKDLHRIVGVTSLGKGCGIINVPAIYTRVSFYIPWIESVVFA